jgi:arylsulfatase
MTSELENSSNQSRADKSIDRRKLLLGTSSIAAAVTLTSDADASAFYPQSGGRGGGAPAPLHAVASRRHCRSPQGPEALLG